MKKIVFATHNKHKLEEMRAIIGSRYQVVDLDIVGIPEDIPETANTLEGNAQMKAEYVFNKLGINCFSDDTGLEVEALNGAPGVFSARYAGENCSFSDNVEKLLKELSDKTNRKARFRTVICFILDGQKHFFEGKIDGIILEKPRGQQGFGYDPVFVPDGFSDTFAEMSLDLKNGISHRGKATRLLVDFLKSY